MLHFLGNTLAAAKSCGKGRLQYRDFSSVSGQKACVTTSPVSKGLREVEQLYIKNKPDTDEIDAWMADMIKLNEELLK